MILAVDPGGTTGVAMFRGHNREPHFEEVHDGHHGFVRWMADQWDEFEQIICESFIPRPGARSMQYDALFIIGWLDGEALLRGVPFKLQSPAQAKSFATNDKLKAAGLYPVGKGHAQDAARHLLTYLAPRDKWIASKLTAVLT